MAGDARIDELLSRWAELRARGETSSAEELCSSRPDLIDALKAAIAERQSEDRAADTGEQSLEGEPHDADLTRLFGESEDEDPDSFSMGEFDDVSLTADEVPLDWPRGSIDAREMSLKVTGGITDALRPPRAAGDMGCLGPFRIVSLLGTGGMGAVFEAIDIQLDRKIALKVMRTRLAHSRTARERFLREARAAAGLEHDHVVPIYQVGEDRGVPYLAMPLLHGLSLKDRLKGRVILPVADALRIAREIAEGLAAAHDRGLIHRDIKPENIWLEEGSGRVKILDFGLARVANEETRLTQDGIVLGTPAYMAPEQASGVTKLDQRTDLYSLGAVLYRMVTGRPAFTDKNPAAVVAALMRDEPAAPRELNPQTPVALESLIVRLMSKESRNRPTSARLVVEEIRALERAISAEAAIVLDIQVEEPDSLFLAKPVRDPWANVKLLFAGVLSVTIIGVVISVAGFLPKLRDIVNDEGRVTLESPVPNVAVAVVQEGRTVAVLAPNSRPTLRLKPGSYRLELSDAYGTMRLSTERLTIQQGDRQVVRVMTMPHVPSPLWETEKVEPWPAASEEDDWPVGLIPRPALLASIGRWQVEPRRPRHTLTALSWNPDGRRLACATGERLVRIYDSEHLDVVGVLMGHTKNVYTVAWSPDGRQIATGDEGGTVRLWNADGSQGPILEERSSRVAAVAWSLDSRRIATSSGRNVRLWTADGAPQATLEGHTGNVLCVAWHPDGTRLVSAAEDGTIRLWRGDGTPGRVLRPQGGFVRVVSWSPDGDRLASGGQDGSVRLWSAEGVPGAVLRVGKGSVADLDWRYDGKRLAVAQSSQVLRIWDIIEQPPRQVQRSSALADFAVAWSPDGKHLATGGQASAPRIWDEAGKLEQVAEILSSVRTAAVRGDGKRLATVLNDDAKVVLFWSAEGEPSVVAKSQSAINSMAWSPTGTRISLGDEKGNLWVKDADASPGRLISGHKGAVAFVAWNRRGTRIATASADHTARIWTADGAPLAVLKGHTGPVYRVAWNPTDDQLMTCSEDGSVRTWDANGKPLREFTRVNSDGFLPAWGPAGQRLVSTGRSSEILFWNADGTIGRPRVPRILVPGATGDPVWHPDGQRLAIASRTDPFVSLYNVNGVSGPTLNVRGLGNVPWVSWSQSGERLIAVADDGAAIGWKTRTLEADWVAFQTSPFDLVAFSGEGRVIGSTPSALKDLLFLVEHPGGGVEVLSHAAFDKRAKGPVRADLSRVAPRTSQATAGATAVLANHAGPTTPRPDGYAPVCNVPCADVPKP